MAGLVLEGGAFRGIFTSGALDALLDEGIYFPYTIGVSSGASYGVSYTSRQRGRNWEIVEAYSSHPRYASLGNFLRCRSIMDTQWVFDEIPNKHIPFDYETFFNSPERFVIGCADYFSLNGYYYEKQDVDPSGKLIMASCALPFYFPPIYFRGRRLVDGGLADPIPLLTSEAAGNESNFVILTKPKSYRHYLKADEHALCLFYSMVSKNAASWLKVRPYHFNHIFERCLREDGSSKNVSIFIPEPLMIERFERDLDKLKALYNAGYEAVISRLDELKDLVRAK